MLLGASCLSIVAFPSMWQTQACGCSLQQPPCQHTWFIVGPEQDHCLRSRMVGSLPELILSQPCDRLYVKQVLLWSNMIATVSELEQQRLHPSAVCRTHPDIGPVAQHCVLIIHSNSAYNLDCGIHYYCHICELTYPLLLYICHLQQYLCINPLISAQGYRLHKKIHRKSTIRARDSKKASEYARLYYCAILQDFITYVTKVTPTSKFTSI